MVAAACGERGGSRQEEVVHPGRVVLAHEKAGWTLLGSRKGCTQK